MRGTAVAVLAVQLQEVSKDVTALGVQLDEHRKEHQQSERDRVTWRRWVVTAAVAFVAAIDGPIVTIFIARGGR